MEWSGILFYSLKGSIKNPKKLVLKVEDILPMDMGSKAYTSYEVDERYMDYLMEDEKRMEWKMGHIHSHNDMSVYFSGTDMSELNDNAPSHNFYLSLIVNNYMDTVAKVAFVGKMEQTVPQLKYMGLDENGKSYPIEVRDFTITKEKLYVMDCEIQKTTEDLKVADDFAKKVEGIIKKSQQPKSTPAVKNNPLVKKTTVPQGKTPMNLFKQWHDENDLFDKTENTLEEFTVAVLNFSPKVEEGITLEDTLMAYEELNMTPYELADSVMHVYAAVYETYFDDPGDSDDFIRRTEQVLEILEENEQVYPILSQTVDTLRQLLIKFEDYEHDTTIR